MANPKAETIIGLIRDLLREESGSDIPVIGDTFLFSVLTDIDYDIRRAYRRGGGNVPVAIHKDTGFTVIGETSLDGAIAITDTTITLADSSAYPESGAIVVWDQDMPDLIYYTGNTANVLSGVTDIGFAHSDGDNVQSLYALPDDFKNFYRTDEYPYGVQLNGRQLKYTDSPPTPSNFTVRDDGTKYLWVYRGASGKISVMYEKTTDAIDSLADRVGFADEWKFYYAWKAIEKALFGKGDYGIIPLATNEASKIKREILMNRNIGRRVRIRPLSITGRRDYLSYNDTH